MARKDDYNWLDDPFDEKKNAQAEQQGMSGASKLAVGMGCLLALIVMIVLVFVGAGALGVLVQP